MNAVDIHAENLIRIFHVKKLANLFTQSLHGFLVNISVVGLPVAGFLNPPSFPISSASYRLQSILVYSLKRAPHPDP